MKVIIPMSGLGKRFKEKGYKDPKPLITVSGKPIIEHLLSLFSKEDEIIFICNEGHIRTTHMKSTLESLAPSGRIIVIPDSVKKGPVSATSYAHKYIDDEDEVFVSYCDYMMEFDIQSMRSVVEEGGYHGAVPAYTGFHPHLLRKQLYGGVLRSDDGRMLAYKEKFSFTQDPTLSHHSAGAYYFKNGKEFKMYSNELLNSEDEVNGEKYTSMTYYLYLRDNKKIYVPEISTFMQWGTPEDLEEYVAWERYVGSFLKKTSTFTDIPKEREEKVIIPYAESSKEFQDSSNYWVSFFTKRP